MTGPDVAALPKAVLHDHLDGGLRVETVVELADQVGYRGLPTNDIENLRAYFHQGSSGSLVRYLEPFTHTVALMQTEEAISRVAYESVRDLADDGVVYAEIRFAPSLLTTGGLSLTAVLEAAIEGCRRAASVGGIVIGGVIACAMRQDTDSVEVATAAAQVAGRGVVGFDLAGPERGFPADDFIEACRIARGAGLGLTVHGGEADGPHSMWRALARCGAMRIGHGVRVVEDCDYDGRTIASLGRFATSVRDHRIPLEVAITSNVHTASVPSLEKHPFGALYREGFNVSINTDNRLMSGVTVSSEYRLAASRFDLTEDDLYRITISAIEAGFGDYRERRAVIEAIDTAR
ncbi:MAG: adenosine deaminase [Acidimicrobiia bacterium]